MEIPHTHDEAGEASRRKITSHILAVERREINPFDKNIGALMPVSIELVQRLLDTGYLMDRRDTGDYHRNEVHVFPTPALIPHLTEKQRSNISTSGLFDPEDLYAYTKMIAEDVGQVHNFITCFGLSLDDPTLHRAVGDYLESVDPVQNIYNEIRSRLGGTEQSPEEMDQSRISQSANLMPFLPAESLERVPSVTEESRQRKGFIVGLDLTAVTVLGTILAIDPSTSEDSKVKLSFGLKGMPYTALAAIEPKGKQEKRFLDDLRLGRRK